MAKFQITAPDGQKYEVTAPDDATEEQVLAYVQSNAGKASSIDAGPAPKGTPQPGLKEQGAKLPGAFRAAINMSQGVMPGFADEAAARVSAVVDQVTGRNPGMSHNDLYTRYRDVARGASEKFQADNPILAPALQAGAGLATGVGAGMLLNKAVGPVAPLLNPATTGGRIAAAAATGGATGAIGGAGTADELSDVPIEMLKGGSFGALTGGILSGAGQGIGAMKNNIAARSPRIQDRIRDGGTGGMTSRAFKSADDLAKERLAVALTRDGRTIEQTSARLNTLGDRAPLAVAGGKNTLDLTDTMATMPGRTPDMVERAIRSQQATRGATLTGAAESGLGTGGMRLQGTLEALDEARSKAAGPLYDKVRQATVQVDDELSSLLTRAKSAFGDAERLAKLKGEPFELPEAIKAIEAARRPSNLSNMLTEKGAPPSVPLSQLDTLKRTLYDIEQANINPETGRLNEIGNAVKNLRRSIVKKADDATRGPDGTSLYESARNVYAGPSELRAAANLGSQAMSKDGWKIPGLTDGMGDAELQAFRIGAMESLRKKFGTESGQTQMLKMWKEPATQEKIRAIFPDVRSYREFAAEVAKEARIKGLETAGRGSQTASRLARQDDEGAAALSEAVGGLASLKAGNPMGILQGVRNLYGRTVMPEPVRDRIGEMLLTRGPQAQGLLGDMSRYMEAEQVRRASQAARSGLLGGVGVTGLLGN